MGGVKDKKKLEDQQAREYLKDLQKWRQEQVEKKLAATTTMIGPTWFYILSPKQIAAIENLPRAINQDILEDRPKRTKKIIYELGILPQPSDRDLMNSLILGQMNPMGFLSELFRDIFGHSVECRREEYSLKSKLLMTSVLYAGLEELFQMLEELFRAPPEPEPVIKKKKLRIITEEKPISPYLQKVVIKEATVEEPKPRPPPPPLPDLEELYELEAGDDTPVIRDPPKPKPPPIPKPTLPRSLCDKVGEFMNFNVSLEPDQTQEKLPAEGQGKKKKTYAKRVLEVQSKSSLPKKRVERAGPPPEPPFANCILHMGGVTKCNGEMVYQVYGVVSQKTNCVMLHCGFVILNGEKYPHYGGYVAFSEETRSKPCDCMKMFPTVVHYLERHKCRCMHYYDFVHTSSEEDRINEKLDKRKKKKKRKNTEEKLLHEATSDSSNWFEDSKITDSTGYNERTRRIALADADAAASDRSGDGSPGPPRGKKQKKAIPPPEEKFFHPPTGCEGMFFDEAKIFEMDEKKLLVKRKVQDIMDTDSLVGVPTMIRRKQKKPRSKCLGKDPTPEEYLKCALKLLKRKSIAASLPDAYKVPELVEWMRFRIKGPQTTEEKKKDRTTMLSMWEFFQNMNMKYWGHVNGPELPIDKDTPTDWSEKSALQEKFIDNVNRYKSELYKMFAEQQNQLWPTMFQHTQPDKSFRRTFFAYMPQTERDLNIYRPYNPQDIISRLRAIQLRPYKGKSG